MDPNETQRQQVDRVTRELSIVIRRQARGRWQSVRTAERNERRRHVWRFQAGPAEGERFLHIDHRSMVSQDAATRLIEQLEAANWMDRLQDGPDAALLLGRSGRLAALPQN